MAAAENVSLSQEEKDASLSRTGAGRGLTTFIIGTALCTALCVLLSGLWSDALEAMPQAPSYQLRNNTFFLDAGKLAPVSTWKYNATAMAAIRNTTMKVHPDTHLVKWKLGKLTKENGQFGHYNTCAVVANSGILLRSHCGAEIDSKDYVIRMDLPVIRGYENDVGKRTDLTFFNLNTPKRILKSSHLQNRSENVYEHRLRNINGSTVLVDRRSKHKINSVVKRYQLSLSLYTVVGSLRRGINGIAAKLANRKFGGNASLGLVTVMMMTTFCDHPYLYGFFPFQKDAKNRPIPYHYYPGDYIKPIRQNDGGHHHMNREYSLFRDLHRRGVLKMHFGPCGKQ